MAFFIREPRTTELEVNDKHVFLRTVLFILSLLIAVSAFAFGVSRIGYKEEGMYALTAAADQELPLYQSGIEAKFLFRGESNAIKMAIGSADKVYTQALKDAYRLLDAEKEYEGFVNLASLNARLNQDVQVSPELFAVLTDAWDKTLEQRGYSLFAGPVYAEWQSILSLSEPADFDPLLNPDEAERLELLAGRCADLDRLRLTVVDRDSCVLRLEAPEDYLAFLREMELRPAVADLNLLREAYLLQLTAAELEKNGLTDGYLSTDSGLILSLSGQKTGQYCLYGYRDGEPSLAATAPVSPGSACSVFTAFPLIKPSLGFYSLEAGGTTHLRNPYLPADGVDAELLLSSCVVRDDGDLSRACYENICLRGLGTAEEAEKLAAESDSAVAWLLRGDAPEQLRLNAAARALFSSPAA